MQTTQWIKGGVASLIFAFGASTASATESGFYVGANLGTSSFDVEDVVEDYFNSGASRGLDDSDTSWSLASGYRFNPHVGVELAYVDLGGVAAYEVFTYLPQPSRTDMTLESSGLAAALTAAIPIKKFEFAFKLGLLFANTEVAYTDTFIGAVDYETDDASSTGVLYGLGMAYTFGDHFVVRVDWTRYSDVGDEEVTSEVTIDTLTGGIAYRF